MGEDRTTQLPDDGVKLILARLEAVEGEVYALKRKFRSHILGQVTREVRRDDLKDELQELGGRVSRLEPKPA